MVSPNKVKTPGSKKLKVFPIGVGIVTCSQPDVMTKFHCSNKSKTLSLQLTAMSCLASPRGLRLQGSTKCNALITPIQ
jgi:hypothetical protein